MQETSVLYNSIISGDHRFEVSLAIGESGRLITKLGEVILFGGTAILVDTKVEAVNKLKSMDLECIYTAHDYHPMGYFYKGKEKGSVL